ncbi:cytochrome P450 [Streptosporangium sp. NPDC023963]|uniref:cytochrome P450 n=1 Tax=Streptosporangium sp. NPDC023963 TaxID=3155608 RepID=UPI0034129277
MTVTQASSTFQRILDHSSRADPYPLYAELRRTPVARQEDGGYVVSTYREITALLHDPHLSSDAHNLDQPGHALAMRGDTPAFIGLDPPQHDRLRRMAMRHFGPPHSPTLVDDLRPDLNAIVTRLIDDLVSKDEIDIVDDFAYPFPVTVICHLLGVPREDEPRFHEWVEAIVAMLDVDPVTDSEDRVREGARAREDLRAYLAELLESRRGRAGDDLLSRLADDDGPDGRMTDEEIVSTANLLLIAGHETTVNLITNGVLTLLRHPDVLERLRRDPVMIIRTVEELLRYEPPVQLIPWRAAFSDLTVADTVIPKGSRITLVLASGNRDPAYFRDPDRFDPDRPDNQHLGFGAGVHLCFGAPLARLEAQIALNELFRNLESPRLVADPPPYRQSAVLRGPRHLLVRQE